MAPFSRWYLKKGYFIKSKLLKSVERYFRGPSKVPFLFERTSHSVKSPGRAIEASDTILEVSGPHTFFKRQPMRALESWLCLKHKQTEALEAGSGTSCPQPKHIPVYCGVAPPWLPERSCVMRDHTLKKREQEGMGPERRLSTPSRGPTFSPQH